MKEKLLQEDDDITNLNAAGMKAIAKQYQNMASALRVIHTWASFGRMALSPKEITKLTEKALKRFERVK